MCAVLCAWESTFRGKHSSLAIFLTCLKGLLPSSVAEKTRYACPVGQLGKLNVCFSWTLPLEGFDNIRIFISQIEDRELTNVKYFLPTEFQCLELQTVGASKKSCFSASLAKRTSSKCTGSAPAVSPPLRGSSLAYQSCSTPPCPEQEGNLKSREGGLLLILSLQLE